MAERSDIPHDWREIHDLSGGRKDLVCWPEQTCEVFVSLTEGQITVGNNLAAEDFEDWGRGLSEVELAEEAVAHFRVLVEKSG